MRLTLYTDYALRTLLYLAVHTDRRVAIREVAQTYGISENHLVKIIHHLGRGGFVHTQRGRGGGLTLGRPPEEICVGDVVRHTEEDMALVGCMSCSGDGPVPCLLAGGCTCGGFWAARWMHLWGCWTRLLWRIFCNPMNARRLCVRQPRPHLLHPDAPITGGERMLWPPCLWAWVGVAGLLA